MECNNVEKSMLKKTIKKSDYFCAMQSRRTLGDCLAHSRAKE
jgi:hypothetical protein